MQGFLDRLRDRIGTIAIAVVILAAIYMLPSELPDTLSGPAFVVDGDSIEIIGRRVRLYGIDAPEAEQDCQKEGRDWPCGREAETVLRRKINGRTVECDPIEFDQYDRVLARCRIGDEELNTWLVRNGWAVAFGAYRDDERFARSNGLGIWSGEFQRPQAWRRERGI